MGHRTAEISDWAKTQIDYILGDTGISFVIGFGEDWPLRAHHAASSCEDLPAPCDWDDFDKPGPNGQTLYGALVGGPDIDDNYNDARDDYVQNEVTIEYNAGYQGALAAMVAYFM